MMGIQICGVGVSVSCSNAMSTISFPSYFAALARRLFNVVSTISISTSYYGLQEEKWHLRPTPHRHNLPPEPFAESEIANGGRRDPLVALGERLKASKSGAVNSSTIPIPSLNRDWWPSFLSTLSQSTSSAPQPSEPPPDLNSKRRTPPKAPLPQPTPTPAHPPDVIHQLMMNPALTDPLRTPRYPIVLCHGLYGFDSRGPTNFPSLRMHYWANTLRILRGTIGAEVIVTSVPGTGSIAERGAKLDQQLQKMARGRGVNFLAHSMGGLDCRHLITHIKPSEYAPLSLTSISTPHRGSPFMDWCVDNIGIGKLRQHERQLLHGGPGSSSQPSFSSSKDPESDLTGQSSSSLFNLTSLPSSFTTLLLSTVDSPAYANLTTTFLNDVFNPATPDDPNVKYFSVAGRVGNVNILHPFWFTKMVVDGVEEKQRARLATEALAGGAQWTNGEGKVPLWADERHWGNDGLVTVQSAQWGEFLGILDNVDHWEMRGARGLEFGVDLPAIPALGLGSAPSATSISSRKSYKPASSESQRKSEAWYMKEWISFATGWVKSGEEKGASSGAKTSATSSEAVADKLSASAPQADSAASTSSNIPSDSSSATTASTKSTPTEEEKRQRQRDFTGGDQVVRSSTDKLSVIVDWIVDQVPSRQVLAGVSDLPNSLFASSSSPASTSTSSSNQAASGSPAVSNGGTSTQPRPESSDSISNSTSRRDDYIKDVSGLEDASGSAGRDPADSQAWPRLEELAMYVVSGSSTSTRSSRPSSSEPSSTGKPSYKPPKLPPDAKPETLATEVKKMMERERKGWRKNELATKKDLERFYVSLARRMYDEGL
ncbi:lipase 2 [Ephemerocybe angulata]|uniref:Lipase 2 n=1 Tax=Ephemerocybe angulata TaxID=980116 RepID=A0A8H6I0L9_9AGAR|nr:lipase 2 [Tulosesus angulatus]